MALINDKQFKQFLELLINKVELRNDIHLGIQYRELIQIFLDDNAIKDYLRYSENKKLLKLIGISKYKEKEDPYPDDYYINEITPNNDFIGPKRYYAVKRYIRYNFYPKDNFILDVSDKKIKGFYKQYQKEGPGQDPKRLISKNKSAYFYKSKQIVFDSEETDYFRVFDVLYENSGQDNFLSYENIDKEMVRRGSPKLIDDQQKIKRIHNAVKNLFLYSRCGSEKLKNTTPNKTELIKKVRGRGCVFNNPLI
ncbi:MAG: hypothetical protein COV29_00230 [Candidatus Yanofskybacteria bacterium CG10_big_fil_rev_8_21_14_0_10_36_16]|uniref:Uncharacterized protein n=1 Tax=Candidatus Yanofskybacteria bacterium CG10_big_fil_rev_8_21_14_0_10_36_16 TaxID=1975096 RepID=A0A2J0QC57_9BACT|nr:MAG: hypothetical protein COV29_00230 [Candidatus Yanofskybacteria bacterium CG10_big_fil_rev_8_21_14_0_10_36_16]